MSKSVISLLMCLAVGLSMILVAGCTCNPQTETQPTTAASDSSTALEASSATAAAEVETTAPLLEVLESYSPSYALDEDGNEVSLTEIFGTAYNTYGGSLTFSEDMSFTLRIGVDKGDGVGTYKIISEEEIELDYKNGKTAVVKVLEISDSVATELLVPKGDFNIIFN